MHKHRVLNLSTLFPNLHTPRLGSFVARSLETLASQGRWDVTVINPIGIPPFAPGRYRPLVDAAKDGIENGVHVYRPKFTLIPRYGARLNPRFIAHAALPIAKRLHAEHPFDLIDAQFFYPDGPAAMTIAKALEIPLTIKARGGDINLWGRKTYARKSMIMAANYAAGLLSVSKALSADMERLGMPRDKITEHYTGLDRDRFRPADKKESRHKLKEKTGITVPEDAPILTTIGGLYRHKGQHIVLSALPSVPDAHLLLIGHGSMKQELQDLSQDLGVTDRVHFLGSLDHNFIPSLLSASDIMVLPSSREGLANAWVESLACGTPIVISDVGGAREVVTGKDAGRIAARDPQAVAQAIKEILANPPSTQAVTGFANDFSWERNGKTLADYYDRLVGAA